MSKTAVLPDLKAPQPAPAGASLAGKRRVSRRWIADRRPAEPRRWTFAEMLAELPETNLPAELWDGELVRSPAPSFFHQKIVDRFHDLLKAWVREHKLGETIIAPLDMVLAPRRSAEVSLPSCQAISTSKPPRARKPLTLPVGQLVGSAGRSWISPR